MALLYWLSASLINSARVAWSVDKDFMIPICSMVIELTICRLVQEKHRLRASVCCTTRLSIASYPRLSVVDG